MTILEPICFICKHFNIEKSTCPAFPGKEIPDEIIEGSNKHSKPLADQENDIVFEQGKPQQ
jgi:hypothetical protein